MKDEKDERTPQSGKSAWGMMRTVQEQRGKTQALPGDVLVFIIDVKDRYIQLYSNHEERHMKNVQNMDTYLGYEVDF